MTLRAKLSEIHEQVAELQRAGIVSFKGKKILPAMIQNVDQVVTEVVDRLERLEKAHAFIQQGNNNNG